MSGERYTARRSNEGGGRLCVRDDPLTREKIITILTTFIASCCFFMLAEWLQWPLVITQGEWPSQITHITSLGARAGDLILRFGRLA